MTSPSILFAETQSETPLFDQAEFTNNIMATVSPIVRKELGHHPRAASRWWKTNLLDSRQHGIVTNIESLHWSQWEKASLLKTYDFMDQSYIFRRLQIRLRYHDLLVAKLSFGNQRRTPHRCKPQRQEVLSFNEKKNRLKLWSRNEAPNNSSGNSWPSRQRDRETGR